MLLENSAGHFWNLFLSQLKSPRSFLSRHLCQCRTEAIINCYLLHFFFLRGNPYAKRSKSNFFVLYIVIFVLNVGRFFSPAFFYFPSFFFCVSLVRTCEATAAAPEATKIKARPSLGASCNIYFLFWWMNNTFLMYYNNFINIFILVICSNKPYSPKK